MIKNRSTGKAGIEGGRTTELPSRIDYEKIICNKYEKE